MTVLPRSAAHVFVVDLAHPEMEDDDAHHLIRVLRVREGESVTVSDGRGSWRTCVMAGRGRLQPTDDSIRVEPPRAHPITVAFGVTKSDKPETVVQKLTEIGVDDIAPVLLDHSIVRWDATKIARSAERFARVAREAAMQSRRVFLPRVHEVAESLEKLLSTPLFEHQWGDIAGGDPAGTSSFAGVSAVVVGPEGGFSELERNRLTHRVSLGSSILRSETAAIAAGVLLVHTRDHS